MSRGVLKYIHIFGGIVVIENVIKQVLQKKALIISPHYNGIHSSIVYTRRQGSISLMETANDVMDRVCRYLGADLQGRIKASRDLPNMRKKPPIFLNFEKTNGVAIPYPSHIRGEDLWVLTENFKIVENGESSCKIILDEQISIEIPRKKKSVENQRLRGIQVLHTFTNNSKLLEAGSMSQVMLLNAK